MAETKIEPEGEYPSIYVKVENGYRRIASEAPILTILFGCPRNS